MKVVFLDAATLPTALNVDHPALAYTAYPSTRPAAVIDRIRDATVVITNKVRLDAGALRSAGQLRLVAVAAAGTDNIDKEAAAQLGIRVANVPDYGSDSVAEHVIASLFALRRQIVTYAAAAIDGRWTASEHFCWNGPAIRDIGGSVFGVVGRGRIGEARRGWRAAWACRCCSRSRPASRPAKTNCRWKNCSRAPMCSPCTCR